MVTSGERFVRSVMDREEAILFFKDKDSETVAGGPA